MDSKTERGQPDNNASSLELLRYRRRELAERRTKAQSFYHIMISSCLFFTAVAFALFFIPFGPMLRQPVVRLGLIAYLLIPWTLLPAYRHRARDVDTDIQELDVQIDLQQFEVSKSESRAEKILHINDFQLRRYYDLNLSQNFWVFSLGIFCIMLGLGVIAATLYLVLHVATTLQAQVVTAILGGTGALFTNVIAAIYLKMNTSASQNLAAFHAKLVETNRLLLANLLASRIEDPEKRGATLANLAVGLAGGSSTVARKRTASE